MSFINLLLEDGWIEQKPNLHYTKGNWEVTYDTSSWIEVGTKKTPRIFDVPVPDQNREQWTLNLIIHLCETDDQIIKNGAK